MKPKLVWPLAGLVLVLLLGAALLAPRLIPPAPQSLTLLPSIWPGDLGFVLIDHLGLDEANGLSLNLPRLETFDDMNQAFRNGTVDILLGTVDTALNLAAQGEEVRVIYAYNDSAGADGVVARADIQTPADLRGRVVGAETGAPSHFLMLNVLARAGLTLNDITFVDVQVDEVEAALTSGQVEAVFTWEPGLSQAAALPGMHLLTTSRDYPGLILNVVIVRRAALEANRDTFIALIRAWEAMRATCEADPTRCWNELAADQGRPAAALAAEAEGIRFLRLSDNRALFTATGGPGTAEAALQDTYTFLRANAPGFPDFDPTALYDPSIVLAAQQ